MATEVLGLWTDVTCSDGINRAFVVNEIDLKLFFERGKKWVEKDGQGDVTVRCKALLKKTKDALVSDRIDTVFEYTNPREREIYDISLQMCSKENGRTFQLDLQSYEYPNLIQLTVGGTDLMATQTLFNGLMADLKEINQWYWFLACRRWLLKFATWAFWLFLVLSLCYGTLSVVGTVYRNYRVRKQYEEWLRTYPPVTEKIGTVDRGKKEDVDGTKQARPKPGEVSPWVEVWHFVWSRQFLAGVGIIAGGILLVRIGVYVFPKAVFEIGKGKQRHERLKAMRKWIGRILTTIIILGIFVPLVKKIVLKVM